MLQIDDDLILQRPVYVDCEGGHKRNLVLAPECSICSKENRPITKLSSGIKHIRLHKNYYLCGHCKQEGEVRRITVDGKTRGWHNNCNKRIY